MVAIYSIFRSGPTPAYPRRRYPEPAGDLEAIAPASLVPMARRIRVNTTSATCEPSLIHGDGSQGWLNWRIR